MQQTIQIGQVQPSVLSRVESIVKNCKAWLNAKSETFFKKNTTFLRKCLEELGRFPIFATLKFKSRYDAAGEEPAFFVPSKTGNKKTTAPCRQAETPRRSRDLSLSNTSCSFFMLKFQIVMSAMTMIQRSSERTVLLQLEGIVKNCKVWLGAKSKTFSALCGEDFTHKEVLIAHKVFFKGVITFFAKSLLGMDILPIFAVLKFKVRYDSAGWEPALFVPSRLGSKKTTAPCRQAETPRRSRTLSLSNTSCSFFMLKFQSVMSAMTIYQRSSERTVLSNVERIVKNCKAWLGAKSKTFSALCGEEFTHKEVLLAHAACVLLIVACGVAEWLEGGAL